MMRDRLLVNLLLAENGIQSETINKRVGEHLSNEEMQCLPGVPLLGSPSSAFGKRSRAWQPPTWAGRASSLKRLELPGRWSSNWPPNNYGTLNGRWLGNPRFSEVPILAVCSVSHWR